MSAEDHERPLERLLAARAQPITGKDGKLYAVRPICPADAPSLIRGYEAMTEQGKWFRMLYAVPHLSEAQALQFCSPDGRTELCIVVEGHGALENDILGGARIMDVGGGRDAEFSVSLRPEARGLGLARAALERVIEVARDAGCRSVWGTIAARNHAMLGLAERIGFEIKRDPDDFSLMIATLPLS
ncbi:MAG: GNAT family N-acetyltransferase [Pikeienuella sp.]